MVSLVKDLETLKSDLFYNERRIGTYHSRLVTGFVTTTITNAQVAFEYSLNELSTVQREEVVAFLVDLQDQSGDPVLEFWNFSPVAPGDKSAKELFKKDKWLYPFSYDVFPSHIGTHFKGNYLGLWCPNKSSRYYGEELPEMVYVQLINLRSWIRVLDLETATQKSPDNFSLVLKYGPEACYPSGLPRTTMNQLHGGKGSGPLEQHLTDINLPSGPLIYYTGEENVIFLPVIRYAPSAYGTLYYGGEYKKNACGTFFYYEATSDSVLRVSTYVIERNKYIALRHLIREIPPSDLRTIAEGTLLDFEDSYGRAGLESYSGLTDEMADAYILQMYTKEDTLDRTLCLVAKEAGYDVVILTHMAGSGRFVTEVLDTRSREESIENLFALDY